MRAFGTDRVEASAGGARVLTCDASKGWRARRPRTGTSPEHPGTAVAWEGAIFEVREAGATPSGGVRYTLAPWEDRHTVRVLERYDAESEGVRLREGQRREGALRRRRGSLLLAPLLGHLPGGVQRRMEEEFGAPARAMTIASALPMLVLGALGMLAFLIESFGGGAAFAGWPILPLPFALYFFVESAIRLGIAFAQEKPMGSAAGVLIHALWTTVRTGRPPAPRGYASRPGAPPGESKEEDR
jgi:hypothetical protein